MAFRQTNSGRDIVLKEWYAWIDQHREKLVAVGLAPEVYLDQSHWNDFLENGHLHWHASSGFDFESLSPVQLTELRHILEREYGTATRIPPLLNWLRIRCE